MIARKASPLRAAPLWVLVAGILAGCGGSTPPGDVAPILEAADRALAASEFVKAADLFTRAARGDPGSARAASGAGLALLRSGKPAESIEWFDRARALEPDAAHHSWLRAHSLAMAGRRDDAITDLEALAEEATPLPEVYGELVSLLAAANRLDEAVQWASDSANLFPKDAGLALAHARTLAAQGRHKDALELFDHARSLRPWSEEPVYGMIESLRRMNRLDEGLSLITLFDELQSRGHAVSALAARAAADPAQSGAARAYIERLLLDQRWEESAKQTLLFLTQFPGDPEGGTLAVKAAEASAQLGDRDSATRLSREAQGHGADSPDDLRTLAEVHLWLGEMSQAMRLYEELRTRDPGDASALLGIARVALQRGDMKQAGEAIDRGLAIAPHDGKTLVARGLYRLRLSDHARSESDLLAGLNKIPGDPEALFGLALLARRAGNLDDALARLRAALKSSPGHSGARTLSGLILAERGNCEEAIPLLADAVAADPGDMSTRAALIRCYETSGHPEQAGRQRRRADRILNRAPGTIETP